MNKSIGSDWDVGFNIAWDAALEYSKEQVSSSWDDGFDTAMEFAGTEIYNDGWDDATESKNKEIEILNKMIKKYEEVIDVYKVREGILRDFIK